MEGKRYLRLGELTAYKIAFQLSNYVWDVVIKWEWFARKTVGVQFVEAADSISANIAEGFGRYHKKDKIHFYRFSSGSVKESFDWNEKSKVRSLLSEEEYNHIFAGLNKLPKEINLLVKNTNDNLKV
ncbi:MAG: four helix bundle protein [Bacteroidetes bacterium]|nr:four helix bundle protein [Bacteroidota bacterium]